MKCQAFHFMLLTALLTGCAATSYDMARIDSPMPKIDGIEPCAERFGRLEKPGDSCLALVRANELFSFSSLGVCSSEYYQFDFPDNQSWYDATRRNADANGEEGSWLMNLAARNKRHKSKPWFFLTPVVVDKIPDEGRIAKHVVECVPPDTSRAEYKWSKPGASKPGFQSLIFGTGKANGYLAFYPNDALFPDQPMQYYENNSGQVWVVITRLSGPNPTADLEWYCSTRHFEH